MLHATATVAVAVPDAMTVPAQSAAPREGSSSCPSAESRQLDSATGFTRVLWLLVSYLAGVFLIPLVLSLLAGFRSLPAGRTCPRCAGETILLLMRPLRALTRGRRRPPVERRWCLACGWLGLVRPAAVPPGVMKQRALPSYRYDAGFTETVDVRTITIDGRTWRVLLQCWTQTRLCYGRLVFVEPTGRLWADACEAFSGTSRFEVIRQALTVPDVLLSSRLRRILSEA